MIIAPMSRLRILGCAGGVGGGRHTTCFLLNDHTLIDAGTGLCTLELAQLQTIDQVVLTHSHLDHVLGIPLLLDAVASTRTSPLIIYGLPQTLSTLKQHFFNGHIWPTVAELGSADQPIVMFKEVNVGDTILSGAVTVLPAAHAIPACGYAIAGSKGTLVFSGDTRGGAAFWQAVNRLPNLTHLIIETSYMNEDSLLAKQAHHLTANDLAMELINLRSNPKILITHLKPGLEEGIMVQIGQVIGATRNVSALCQGDVIDV